MQRPRRAAELSPLERQVIAAHADEWPGTVDAPGVEAPRLLYRARRGLRYGPLHWELTGPKGKLWGLGTDALLPAEDLTEILIFEHAWDRRTDDRLRAALEYYDRRDEAGVENPEVLAAARAIKARNAPLYLNEDPTDTSTDTLTRFLLVHSGRAPTPLRGRCHGSSRPTCTRGRLFVGATMAELIAI